MRGSIEYMDINQDRTVFSIIVPVYNVEKYLPHTLDSIINQSFESFEVICIDDGSTDRSKNVLNDYGLKDKRIKVFSQENAGPGAARNIGISNASGKYVLFVDADDWLESNALEYLYEKFSQTNANIIQFDYKAVNKLSGKERLCVLKKDISLKNAECYNWKFLKEKALVTRLMAWDKAYSLDFIRKNNMQFACNKHAEEHIFTIKGLLLTDKVYYLEKCLYNYNNRPNSSTNIQSNDNFCIFDNVQLLKDFLVKYKLDDVLAEGFKEYKQEILYIHYANIIDEQKSEYLKLCRTVLSGKEYKKMLNRIKHKERSFLERIFSIKNRSENSVKKKVLTIIGMEFIISPKNEGECNES